MSTENQYIDLFIHSEGVPPKHVRAGSQESLEEVLRRVGLELRPGLLVFVGQPPSALGQPDVDLDDAEDAHDPANPANTLAAVGIAQSGHLHCHHCRRVGVTVRYNGREARRRFSPASTVRAVTAWARHRFKLTDADAEKLVLQVCDSTRRPRQDEHLGELAHAPECRLCFDLVPEQKIEG